MDFSTTMRRLRRSIASFSVLAIVASLSIVSAVSAFSDVPESAPYASYVSELLDLGIISNNATFRPADKLSRAEAAKIAVKAAGVEDADLSTKTGTFSDVSAKLWDGMAQKYIETAAELKIVNGDAGKKTFRPNDDVTRAELAAIIVRAYELAEDTAGGPHFSDVTSAFWGYNVVETAYNWSVVNGYGDNSFKPNAKVIRQDMAAMVSRANAGEKRVTTPGETTGPVSVALASDNPAGYPVITNQSGVVLAKFTFTGTGTVTALNLKRLGVSADASLGNVYLFEGDTRISDASSVSSGSVVNFTNASGLFAVAGSKTISVRADLAAASGESLGVALTGFTAGGTATAANLSGNLFSTAGSNSTLASFQFAATASASGATDPGLDVLVWQNTVTVGTRDVALSRFALRQIGSIQSTDIKNFKLYVDGIQVATAAALDANGYATFSGFTKAMTTGSRIVKVTADVIGGSGRNVQFSLRGTYDVMATDSQYNAGVKATLASGSFPLTPSAFNVNAGTITVVKATSSQSLNVVPGTSDQSLATYTFTAYGESVKIETLNVGIVPTLGSGNVTDVTFRNVRILVNGAQVGNTTNVAAAATYASGAGQQFTTNFTVVPGTPVTVEIRSDMVDTTDAGGNTTDQIANGTMTAIQAMLIGGTSANNAVPQVSLGTLDVPSQDNVTGSNVSVGSATISLAKQSTYGDQTLVAPATAYKLGAFNLNGNSSEAVNINTIEIDFTSTDNGDGGTDADFDASADLTDLYVKYGTQTTSVKGSVTDTNNIWSVNFPLGVNQTMPIEVYATVGSSVSTDDIRADVAVTGITAVSGNTIVADTDTSNGSTQDSGVTGQLITGGTGTIKLGTDASTPVAALVDDSGTVTASMLRFEATYENYTITDLTVEIPDASSVQTINLMDGGSAVVGGSKPGATSVTFNGLNIAVNKGTPKLIGVQLVMGGVGSGAGTTGAALTASVSSVTARDSQGAAAAVKSITTGNTVGTAGDNSDDVVGSAMYVFKAIPTVSLVALPTTLLTTGTASIAKFSVGSNGTGTIGWKKFVFSISKTGSDASDPALSAVKLYDADTNVEVLGTPTFISADSDAGGPDATTDCAYFDTVCTLTFVATSEQQVSGSKTYVLKSTVAATLATGDNVNVTIGAGVTNSSNAPTTTAATTGHANPAVYGNDGTTGASGKDGGGSNVFTSFVWTDVSIDSHSVSTADWNNSYLVKNIPTDSQSLSK